MSIALEEFSSNDYESASVSRIVARARIAKGSIYQYFEDKRDFYLHLVDECSRVLLDEVTRAGTPPSGEDVFDLIRWQMTATVRAAASHPQQALLLERAYSAGAPLVEEMRERARTSSADHFTPMLAAAKQRGEINPEIDLAVALFVVQAVMSATGRFLAASLGLDADVADPEALATDEAEEIFDQIITAIRRGLSAAPR